MEFLILPSTERIIRFSIVILLEIRLQPLAKLKVILVLSFDKLIYFDVSLNAILVESVLKDLVVIYVFVFVLSIPLYFAELESARIEAVKDSAVDSTCGALFDLCEL